MNHCYTLVWSTLQQAWIVVGELAKQQGKSAAKPAKKSLSRLAIFGFCVSQLAPIPALASNWTGTTGDWFNGSDWSSGVPTSSTPAYINNTGTVQITTTGAESSGLNVGSTAFSGSSGTLEVTSGGDLTVYNSSITVGETAEGTLNIDGAGSSVTHSSNRILVGYQAKGTVNISNGGALTTSGLSQLGVYSGGDATFTIDGVDSIWTNNGNVYIGAQSPAEMTITNGGSLITDTVIVGYFSTGSGVVVVDGSGSNWVVNENLNLGYSGSGALTISDGGTVNVNSGAGTVQVTNNPGIDGSLNIGADEGSTADTAGTLNAATVYLKRSSAKLIFNHTDTGYDFTADITGEGAIKLLAGTTSFSGDLSGHTGTANIDGGTLTIAEGDTLNFGGDYNQTTDGILQIGASSASSYGKLNITGTATFAADTNLKLDVAGVNTLANGEILTEVITAGTLSATTFTMDDNSALFDFSATVNGDNTIDINVVSASSGGSGDGNIVSAVRTKKLTSGMGAAKVLDGFVNGGTTGTDIDTVVTELGKLSTDQQVSDAVAETLPLLTTGTTQVSSDNMHSINRIIQARNASFSGLSTGEGFISDKAAWFKPVGNWTDQDSRNGANGYEANSWGFVTGIDGERNDNSTLGFAFSYMQTDVTGKDSSSGNSADISAYQAIVYGNRALNTDWTMNWQADIGINKNDGERYLSFIDRTASAKYDSLTAHIGAGAAKSYELDEQWTLVPSIRADYAYIRDDSYSESGAGALNLDVDSHDSDELIVMVEGHLSYAINETSQLTTHAGLGYDMLNSNESLTASYSGGGTAFVTEGLSPSPWLAKAGVALQLSQDDNSLISVQYDLEGQNDFLSQTASVKYRWNF